VKRSSVGHFPCSVARTLDVVGEWWTPLILRDVFYGARRFEQILGDLGVSRNILTDRLNTLVDNEILQRRRYSDRPPRYEYRLTDRGSELLPVLLALMEWGDKWLPDGGYAVAVHKPCGHRVHGALLCEECGAVPSREVRFRPGPGAPAPPGTPAATQGV
jgi:DNA-binding HxlR family transcriptional regulator